VLQGEREMSADNRSLARFELTGIPPAPRGVPKIQVTFRIDANGILSVEARDLGTGRSQAVSVQAASGLSGNEIDRIVQEGERFRVTDELRRDLAELRNQAETLIYTTEQALEAYADLLDADRMESVRRDLDTLKVLIESGADLQTLRQAYAQLENATFEIAEAMYGGAAG
jgi:molecular chaperone DnaK